MPNVQFKWKYFFNKIGRKDVFVGVKLIHIVGGRKYRVAQKKLLKLTKMIH